MYVVLELMPGVVVEPPETGVTEPIELSIVNEVASRVLQVSVEVSPLATMTEGDAVSLARGSATAASTAANGDRCSACTAPPGPVTVPVKVVLLAIAGDVVAPPGTGVTAPMPLSIEKLVAFAVVHVRDEVWPAALSVVGLAVSVQVGAGGGGGKTVTVTAAVHVLVPPGPVTVPVKVVLEGIGCVGVEPLASGVTAPIPLSIEKLVPSSSWSKPKWTYHWSKQR